MPRLQVLVLACCLLLARAQCPAQLPSDSICKGSAWIVNQTSFFLADELDIGVAAVNFTGSYLQYPNATLVLSWDGTLSGVVNVFDQGLISGSLLVRFTARPKNGAKLRVLTSGTIIGGFQSFAVALNYTDPLCDVVSIAVDEADAASTTEIAVTVSKGNSCSKDKHIPLIVVCVLSGLTALAVVVYLFVTECRHVTERCCG